MSLPDESYEAAAELTADWDDDPARAIYEHLEEMDYGLAGALERGLNVRHLHETDDERNCYEHAIHAYTLAEESGLEPRFFEIEEGQTSHAFIDLEIDGTRYLLDQGRFGPIQDYSDHQVRLEDSPVNDSLTKNYRSITEQSEDQLSQDIEDLREDTVAMLARGQRLEKFETGETTVYDKLNFDRDEDALERMISVYEPEGHLNHLIRVRRYIDEDGEVEDTETILADIDSAGWNTAWGERKIGQLEDGRLQPADELPDELKENVARVMDYEQQAGDGLIYTDSEREQLWDQYSTAVDGQIGDGYTGFRGKDLKEELDRLRDLRDDDPERFHTELDWMRYLADTVDEPIPDDETVKQMLPAYIDRHKEILEAARDQDHHGAIETILEDMDSPTRETAPELNPGQRIDEIRDRGLASSYDDLADDLDQLRDGETADLGQHQHLLAADPSLREQTTELLQYLAAEDGETEIEDQLQTVQDALPSTEEDLESPYDTITDSWELDPDEMDLTRSLLFDDGTVSTYDAILELTYDIDPIDPGEGIAVSMYETPDGIDERLHYGTFTVEDESEIDLETIQETALGNLETIRDQTPLNAPEPQKDSDVFEENTRAIALYSIYFRDDEDMPHLWTEDELDAFNQQVREEAEFALASPFVPVDQKDEAREEIALVTDMFDDDWQHYAVAQHNKLESLRTTDPDRFEDLIEERFEPEEMAEEYVKKFYDIANEHVLGDEDLEQAHDIRERVEDGLQASLPDPAEIQDLASETGLASLTEATRTVESTGYSWEQKAQRLEDSLEALEDDIDLIESEQEKKELEDALVSLHARMTDRERYQDWEGSDELDDRLEDAQATVEDHVPFEDRSDEIEMDAVLDQLA
jgi:hypothetical protein